MATGYNATKFGRNNKVDYIKEKNIRFNPDKDYSEKKNILGQQKSRVSSSSETINKVGKPGITYTFTTTKTKSISPNRTAVTGPGRLIKSKSRGSDNVYYTPKTKVRTVKNKNVDKFLEKNPNYKVTDGTLKTKTRTEKEIYDKGELVKKNVPPISGYQWSEWVDLTTDAQRERGINQATREGRAINSLEQYEYAKPKVTKDKSVKVGKLAQARRDKAKNLIGIRTNKVKK